MGSLCELDGTKTSNALRILRREPGAPILSKLGWVGNGRLIRQLKEFTLHLL
jgi:hypothetical protein